VTSAEPAVTRASVPDDEGKERLASASPSVPVFLSLALGAAGSVGVTKVTGQARATGVTDSAYV
jgi:hypothetical protein